MGRGVIYSMSDVYKLSTGCVIVGNVLKNWKYIAVIVMMACSGFSAPQKDEKAGFFLAGVVDTKSIAGSQEREKQLVSMLDALSSASSELAVESSVLLPVPPLCGSRLRASSVWRARSPRSVTAAVRAQERCFQSAASWR